MVPTLVVLGTIRFVIASWTSLLDRGAAVLEAADRAIPPLTRRFVSTYGLLLVFVLVTAERLLGAWRLGTFAIDLRIYRAAAEAALRGANPWTAAVDGLGFAAPPPTLLPYFPAALLPELLAIAIYGALTLGAAMIAIRALHLPVWWLLFPPIVDSLVVLNPDVIVIALLLAGGRLTTGASLPFKVYAAIPLLIARRWVPLAVGVGLCLLSVPWWMQFIEARDAVTASLQAQSFGGLSAWGTWLLFPTALALVALRDRDAQWLAVPALWPYTQLHYAALALPVAARSPIVAFGLSFPVALLTPIVITLYAIGVVLRRRPNGGA
jgi:hypothetical protein